MMHRPSVNAALHRNPKRFSPGADLGFLLEPFDEGQEELTLEAPLVQLVRVPATTERLAWRAKQCPKLPQHDCIFAEASYRNLFFARLCMLLYASKSALNRFVCQHCLSGCSSSPSILIICKKCSKDTEKVMVSGKLFLRMAVLGCTCWRWPPGRCPGPTCG